MLEEPRSKQADKEEGTTMNVPQDQAWLLNVLSEQTNILKGIRTAVQIVAVFIILSVIFAACSALF